MINWILDNKEWLFSGVGVVVISGAIALIVRWYFSRRQNINVELRFGILALGPELGDDTLLFTISNASEKVVHIAGIRIPLRGKGNLYFPYIRGERQLPCALEPGNNVKFWVPLNEVERLLKKAGYRGEMRIRGVVQDALGRDHKSNKFGITLKT